MRNLTIYSVKLRQTTRRHEWSLYLEAYPVIDANGKKTRKRESLNVTITTLITDSKGAPKRDINGVIQCQSIKDRKTCAYADRERQKRQDAAHERAINPDLYDAREQEHQLGEADFIDYVKFVNNRDHDVNSAIYTNWSVLVKQLKRFTANSGSVLPIKDINVNLINDFKRYILKATMCGSKKGILSQNTARTYFNIFKAALHYAYKEGYLKENFSEKVEKIPAIDNPRQSLTIEEIKKLYETPCDHEVLRRAAFFSILTGFRLCDIQALRWKDIEETDNGRRISILQQKTSKPVYMPMLEEAYAMCGEPSDPERLIFEDLPDSAWISRPLARWIKSAGITKHITFHCFRHTFAVQQIDHGANIFVLSKLMGHTNVKTTQIYAKATDEKKRETIANLKFDFLTQKRDDLRQ